ncbi:hypothetical protein D3C80_1906650 [compost metagenome]
MLHQLVLIVCGVRHELPEASALFAGSNHVQHHGREEACLFQHGKQRAALTDIFCRLYKQRVDTQVGYPFCRDFHRVQ